MGIVVRVKPVAQLILITHCEIGITPNELPHPFRWGHIGTLTNPVNLYLASEFKLNISCAHVTMVPLLCPPQCAREQGQHHQGDPLHPQGECEEEHEERGHVGEGL